jgi:type II restriction enzyme
MVYCDKIEEIIKNISTNFIDFSKPKDKAKIPRQASSNFIINKEQGDWAENLLIRAINKISKNFVAVKYGKSDNLIAGQEGFEDFYEQFQNELDTIGKRPDLLLFKKSDYLPDLGLDISHICHEKILDYVKKAIAGIEVRSSAFLIDQYDDEMKARTENSIKIALEIRDKILKEYADILSEPLWENHLEILKEIKPQTLAVIDFKLPKWRSTKELSQLLKQLRQEIKKIQKRDYLSITPKVEDIKVVYKWIKTFNVPHFYFQVFFDKVYGISFQKILELISNPDNEGTIFSIEADTKNQNKTTIKINSKASTIIASKIDEPFHESVRKQLNKGRLLFYVTFKQGNAYLDIKNFKQLLDLKPEDF